LKLSAELTRQKKNKSPPARGRGLKPSVKQKERDDGEVAPRAGARIETSAIGSHGLLLRVAPRAGARIETA